MHWAVVPGLFCLLWGAVVFLGIRTIARPRTDRANLYAGGGALVAALVVGIVLAPSSRAEAPVGAAAGANDRPCAGVLKPAARVAHGYVDAVQTLPDGAAVAPGTAIGRTATVVLRGWASDAEIHHALAGVCLLVDGKALKQQRVSYGSSRPDVVQALHDTALLDTGYEIRMLAADVAPGRHRLEVVGVDGTGRESAIAPPLNVVFR